MKWVNWGTHKQMKDKNILILFSVAFFDRDARRSGPTIHFEVDPNIEFVEAFWRLQIGL